MNKLKFNRLLDVSLGENETTAVPKNELWKGIAYGQSSYLDLMINGIVDVPQGSSITAVGGSYFKASKSIRIQGIAFKVVENV